MSPLAIQALGAGVEEIGCGTADMESFDQVVEAVFEAAQQRPRARGELGVRECLTKLVLATELGERRRCEEAQQQRLSKQSEMQAKILSAALTSKAQEADEARSEQQRRHKAALAAVELREHAAVEAARNAEDRARAALERAAEAEKAVRAGCGDDCSRKAALAAAEQRERAALAAAEVAEERANEATQRATAAERAEAAATAALANAQEAAAALKAKEQGARAAAVAEAASAKENIVPPSPNRRGIEAYKKTLDEREKDFVRLEMKFNQEMKLRGKEKEELAKVKGDLDARRQAETEREAMHNRYSTDLEAQLQRKSAALQELEQQFRLHQEEVQAKLTEQRKQLSAEREQARAAAESSRRGADAAEVATAEMAAKVRAEEAAAAAAASKAAAAEETAARAGKEKEEERAARRAAEERAVQLSEQLQQAARHLQQIQSVQQERLPALPQRQERRAPQHAQHAHTQQDPRLQKQRQQLHQLHQPQHLGPGCAQPARLVVARDNRCSSSSSSGSSPAHCGYFVEPTEDLVALLPSPHVRMYEACSPRGRSARARSASPAAHPPGVGPNRGKRRFSPGPPTETTADLEILLAKAARVSAPAKPSAISNRGGSREPGGRGPMGPVADARVTASDATTPRSPILVLSDSKATPAAAPSAAPAAVATAPVLRSPAMSASPQKSAVSMQRPWRRPAEYSFASSRGNCSSASSLGFCSASSSRTPSSTRANSADPLRATRLPSADPATRLGSSRPWQKRPPVPVFSAAAPEAPKHAAGADLSRSRRGQENADWPAPERTNAEPLKEIGNRRFDQGDPAKGLVPLKDSAAQPQPKNAVDPEIVALQARAAALADTKPSCVAKSSTPAAAAGIAAPSSRAPSQDVVDGDIRSRVHEAYSRAYAKAPTPGEPGVTRKLLRARKEVEIVSSDASAGIENVPILASTVDAATGCEEENADRRGVMGFVRGIFGRRQ